MRLLRHPSPAAPIAVPPHAGRRELDEELRYHLERQIEEHIAGRLTPRMRARRRCGRSAASNSERRSVATCAD